LLGGFLEQTLGHDEPYIAASNEDLLEAALHPTDTVGYKGEARPVENCFLNSCHEYEAQILGDLSEKVDVNNRFLFLAIWKIVEQLTGQHQNEAIMKCFE